jgi:hypothetical protein
MLSLRYIGFYPQPQFPDPQFPAMLASTHTLLRARHSAESELVTLNTALLPTRSCATDARAAVGL